MVLFKIIAIVFSLVPVLILGQSVSNVGWSFGTGQNIPATNTRTKTILESDYFPHVVSWFIVGVAVFVLLSCICTVCAKITKFCDGKPLQHIEHPGQTVWHGHPMRYGRPVFSERNVHQNLGYPQQAQWPKYPMNNTERNTHFERGAHQEQSQRIEIEPNTLLAPKQTEEPIYESISYDHAIRTGIPSTQHVDAEKETEQAVSKTLQLQSFYAPMESHVARGEERDPPDISQRPPFPLPQKVLAERQRYKHYDTPYEERIFRLGRLQCVPGPYGGRHQVIPAEVPRCLDSTHEQQSKF